MEGSRPIRKLLVANRGEIACRVLRTARRLGIATVAVYSDADADGVFVQQADEAVHIGPPLAAESYLNMEKIISAAKRTGADAIHPGYGFLSENADFAQRVEEAGLLFVGPRADSIRAIGSKRGAKLLLRVRDPAVPLIPGYDGTDQSAETLSREAQRLGFPVLLKASAGGGGKGMRVVHAATELRDAIEGAQTEARNSFGDDTLLIERYFTAVRHVEVQIMGDAAGQAVHLYERECSVQRRHQKIIEESPSPVMTAALRRRMGEAAVRVARLIGYRNAGTVEFVVEPSGAFYFLEVNTRLQVEHPVTELVTGLDLVELQLRIAAGATLASLGLLPAGLALGEAPVAAQGHAIECRLYAEDPANHFFPCTGTLHLWRPAALPGVRYDTGVRSGSQISVHYDPLVAKVVCHGPTRAAAIALMLRALAETAVLGLRTNKHFLQQVLAHPRFQAGDLSTHFIHTHMPDPAARAPPTDQAELAALAAWLAAWAARDLRRTALAHVPSAWRNNPYRRQRQALVARHAPHAPPLVIDYALVAPPGQPSQPGSARAFEVEIGGRAHSVVLHEYAEEAAAPGATATLASVDATVDGLRRRCDVVRVPDAAGVADEDELLVHSPALGDYAFALRSRFRTDAADDAAQADTVYLAPMPAKVFRVLVKDGVRVAKGQALVVLESMKMETKVYALRDGVVRRLGVAEGQLVTAGQLLLELADS